MTVPRVAAITAPLLAALLLLPGPRALSQVDVTDLPGTIEGQYYASPSSEAIDNLVDNNPQTKYLTFHAACWVRFNLATPYAVVRYALTSANDAPYRDPASWTLEGSNDGVHWVELDRRSGEIFGSRYLRKEYAFTNVTPYSSYRLSMTCYSGDVFQLAEWELWTAPLDADVSPVSVSAPSISPLIPVHPVVSVRNNGSAPESFPLTCQIDSAGTLIYSQSLAVTALPPGSTQSIEFPLWTPGGNGSYSLSARSFLETDQVPANDRAITVTGYRKRVYIVPYAHMDLQWDWTLQTTIDRYLPQTLAANFALLEKYPDYRFNFEGAYRYNLIKQYYPQDYERLKGYIAQGRWNPSGGMVEATDLNIPSPEALIRHILYGNRFFQQEFGRPSADLLLPDCFGFPFTLPTIAAHCGIRGFSSSKFNSWGGFRPSPFSIGQWEGVDGSRIVAVLQPGSMWSTWEVRADALEALGRRTGVYADLDYLSTGDTGGAPPDSSVASLSARIQQNDTSAIEVLCTSSDQLFRDLTPDEAARLPLYRGELLLTRHGTGCYTAREDQKILNRADELTAFAAEQASVLAEVEGGPAYPSEEIRRQWFNFLAHDFHDDLAGVCGADAYTLFSTPARQGALASFLAIRDEANRAVAAALDTRTDDQGVPLVVWNPAAFDRHDMAEASIRLPGGLPPAVRVYDARGAEVPSQLLGPAGDSLRVLFAADVPAAGYAVYQVKPAAAPSALPTELKIDAGSLENTRYRVLIDENGDPSSIIDKRNGRELLAGPSRFAVLADAAGEWPAWEIFYNDVSAPPRSYAGAPVTKTVVDSGAARVTLRVTRMLEGSSCTHDYALTADTNGFLQVTTTIDWKATDPGGSLLKLTLPLTVSNPMTTYDLGLGTVQRGVNSADLYEVPGQQWADISQPGGAYGVALLSDCKYGWDKPAENVIRLTLIHSPSLDGMNFQGDRFLHHFTCGIYGHTGDWSTGGVISAAARLNQPLVAFQTTAHAGTLGKVFPFLTLDPAKIAVMALKKAEDDDSYILRVREVAGRDWTGVTVGFNAMVITAQEVDGMEAGKGPVGSTADGIVFSIAPYQVKAFAVRLTRSGGTRDVSLSAGWTLVSLPVRTPDSSAAYVYPGSTSPAFGYRGAYAPTASLTPGKGYWLKFSADKTCSVRGTQVTPPDIPLTAGWNLIGPYETGVPTSAVTSTPVGIVASDYYGYADGYTPVGTLETGKGYWVKASQAGVLHLPAGMLRVKGGAGEWTPPRGDPAPVKLEITDARGAKAVVLLVRPEQIKGNVELPPIPPDGVLDVRFVQDNSAVEPLGRRGGHQVRISGASYPVRLRASGLAGKALLIKDPLNGETVNATLTEGRTLMISQPFPRLLVQEAGELPASYELSQNYPNPCNPSTTIRFAVPEDSYVSLEVFDLLGQRVATLAEGACPAGYHRVELATRNLATGTYFYRMAARPVGHPVGGTQTYSNVRKFLVLK